jgi:pantoate--beta-alanine ligase
LGALHAGHASLIDAARRASGASGSVLVTIFVNPMQFGAMRT